MPGLERRDSAGEEEDDNTGQHLSQVQIKQREPCFHGLGISHQQEHYFSALQEVR